MLASPRLPLLLLAALVGVHGAWLMGSVSAGIISPDAHGYLLAARLLAEGHLPRVALTNPVQLIGMHWADDGTGGLVSRYPPGLPVLLAAAIRLAGPAAMVYVSPLLASGTLLGVYALAQRRLSPWAGLVAALVVASLPPLGFYALNGDAHTAVAFCLVGGLALLLRHTDAREAGRPGVALGVAAGLLLGAIPSLRYAEAVSLAPVAVFLVARGAATWPALGAMVPLAGLLVLNRLTLGSWSSTGYAATGEESAFALSNVAPHLAGYLREVPREGMGPWAFLGAMGAGLWAARARDAERATVALVLGCVGAIVLVYLGFYFGPGSERATDQSSLRYLLPTFPLLAVAGTHAAWALPWRSVLLPAVLAVQLAWALPRAWNGVETQAARSAAIERLTRVTTASVPEGSVVVAPVALAEALEVARRWKVAGDEVLSDAGGPVRMEAVERTSDSPAARAARSGRWGGLTGAPLREAVLGELVGWAAGAPIVVWSDRPEALRAWLPRGWRVESVAEVLLPELSGLAVRHRRAEDRWTAWRIVAEAGPP